MLSKLSTLILGTLAANKKNPYEIIRFLKNNEINKWFSIADSTVYATINSLRKKGLIAGEKQREGNFPEKTVYSITAEGEYELHHAIAKYIEQGDLNSTEFDIGILLMHNLSKEELLNMLKSKLEKLESNSYEWKRKIVNNEMNFNKPFTGLTILKHRLYLAEAEMKTIKELIKEINMKEKLIHSDEHLDLRLQ